MNMFELRMVSETNALCPYLSYRNAKQDIIKVQEYELLYTSRSGSLQTVTYISSDVMEITKTGNDGIIERTAIHVAIEAVAATTAIYDPHVMGYERSDLENDRYIYTKYLEVVKQSNIGTRILFWHDDRVIIIRNESTSKLLFIANRDPNNSLHMERVVGLCTTNIKSKEYHDTFDKSYGLIKDALIIHSWNSTIKPSLVAVIANIAAYDKRAEEIVATLTRNALTGTPTDAYLYGLLNTALRTMGTDMFVYKNDTATLPPKTLEATVKYILSTSDERTRRLSLDDTRRWLR